VVFENIEDFHARIDDPDLDIDEYCVMVLKNCGPRGYPGMSEVGNMPLPPKVLQKGITDMVRISDGRMSGTAYGTVVLHTSPEAAAGGTLALVRNGDVIELDVPGASPAPRGVRRRTHAPPHRVAAALAAHPGLGQDLRRPCAAGPPRCGPGLPRRRQRSGGSARVTLNVNRTRSRRARAARRFTTAGCRSCHRAPPTAEVARFLELIPSIADDSSTQGEPPCPPFPPPPSVPTLHPSRT
jgi:hypothetical protein